MPKPQEFYPLKQQKPDVIKLFYDKTKYAIQVLSITYLAGILFFLVLFMRHFEYSYLLLFLPLFGYAWLVTFGAKHANNHYGFKCVSGETMIYLKRRKESYATYTAVFVVIFLVSSLIRLICEIKNLVLIKRIIQ